MDNTGHVVEKINLYFSRWDETRKTHADVESVDARQDIALLRLASPAPIPACPQSSNTFNGKLWESFGHPKPARKWGIAIGGTVADAKAITGQEVERHVIQLRCHEACDPLNGASGSPVFVGGRVVGIITNQAQMWDKYVADGKQETKPSYNILFALPMEQIVAIPEIHSAFDWSNLQEVSGDDLPSAEPTEAELLQQYRQIIESIPILSSIKVPGGSGVIETVPLETVYVEPKVSGLTNLDEIWSRQRVAVIGEEGAGKGAFLKYLKLRLLRQEGHLKGEPLWPLRIELSRYAKQDNHIDLVKFALDDLLGRGENEQLRSQLETCNRDGRLVLLCDGLDDVGSDYERVVEALSRQRRFIVALRPGQRMDVGQESGATLRLQPFDRQRIWAFVGKWAKAVTTRKGGFDKKRVLKEIASQSSFMELARTPRFLGLICSVMSGGETVVPTRTALISTAWDTVWQATFGNERFSRRRAAAKALQNLAGKMFDNDASVRQEFDEGELYDALEQAGEDDADTVIASLIEHEIIAITPGSGYASRSFHFLFESFQEYLAAERLANDDDFLAGLSTLKLDSRWGQSLPLVAGIIGRNDKRLAALRDFFTALGEGAVGETFGLQVCLVAECLSEIDPDLMPRLSPFPEQTAAELLQIWKEQPMTRNHMMPALRRLQPAAVRHGLEKIHKDTSSPPDQRGAAVFGLSAYGDPEAITTLVDIAASDNLTAVRTAACLALALLDHEDAATALVHALRDQEMQVRAAAAGFIARRRERDQAQAVIEAWLDTEPRRQRIDNELLQNVAYMKWVTAIAALRPEATLPALLRILDQGDPSVKSIVMNVLAEDGTRAGVLPGIRILESPAADPTTKQVAAQMLIRIGTEAANTALRQAFRRGDGDAKLGALMGFAIVEQLRESVVADLYLEPTDASFNWSLIRPIELEVFEAQAAQNRAIIMPHVEEKGRKAVLSEARKNLAHTAPPAREQRQPGDVMGELAELFPNNDDSRTLFLAFETIQLLEPDTDLLVDCLFGPNSLLVLRASNWLRARPTDLPIDDLLVRLDALSQDAANLAYLAAVNVLARIEHLCTLLKHHRAGSPTATQALWLLRNQFGFRLYEDGRIEFVDGRLETDCKKVVQRLQHLDEAIIREDDDTNSEESLSFEAANGEYLAALGTRPEDGPGWASLAVVESLLGETETAISALGTAIEIDEKIPLWHRFRGALYCDSEAYEEAARDFERAIELGDTWDRRYVELGGVYIAVERFEKAAKTFSLALEAEADHPDALYGRAWARFELSMFEKAVEDLDALLKIDPHDDQAVKLRARANAKIDRPDEALKDLEAVDAAESGTYLQPADAELWDVYLKRARQNLISGDLDAAHTDAKRVIIANPLHPNSRVLRARVWVEQGNPDFAITDLTDLAARCHDSDSQKALTSALGELIELQNVDAPENRTEQQHADAHGVRGVVLAKLGVWDRARADLEKAVEKGATHWKILTSLAWLYLDHFEVNFDQATQFAQDALKSLDTELMATDEDRGEILHCLGWSYHKRGMRDEAMTALEQAASLCPDNKAISEHRDLLSNTD